MSYGLAWGPGGKLEKGEPNNGLKGWLGNAACGVEKMECVMKLSYFGKKRSQGDLKYKSFMQVTTRRLVTND